MFQIQLKDFKKNSEKNFWFEINGKRPDDISTNKISTIEKLLKRISPDELKKLCPELFIRK